MLNNCATLCQQQNVLFQLMWWKLWPVTTLCQTGKAGMHGNGWALLWVIKSYSGLQTRWQMLGYYSENWNQKGYDVPSPHPKKSCQAAKDLWSKFNKDRRPGHPTAPQPSNQLLWQWLQHLPSHKGTLSCGTVPEPQLTTQPMCPNASKNTPHKSRSSD